MKFGTSRPASHWLGWGGSIGLLLVIVGCGGDGIPRSAVSGTVSLDGQPLEEGVILFSPVAEGQSSGGDIVQGKYVIDENLGPTPGEYTVAIRAYRSTGKTVRDEASGTVEEVKVSIVPPRYNNQTTLTATVTPEGPNEFNFELSGK